MLQHWLQMYLAGAGSLVFLVEHKGLPGGKAVPKGVAMPQRCGLAQLRLHILM